ncbi:MAG: hypothetical protein WCK13_01975 [Ignavibacteriota bacterium]|nr:hypothetical protein [Ignavibacteriota bacterium]
MTKKFTKGFKYLLIVVALGFSFTGAECEKLLTASSGDVAGTWKLVKMQGNLQDVCLGEIAVFNSGTATLTCPGATSVTKSYSYTNSVLTYTASGVTYNVAFTAINGVDKMVLTATGIERVLTYDKYSK